jgi:hypothetical protein
MGFCSICKTHGQLTWDHVPPKGCVRPSVIEIKNLSEHISPDNSVKPSRSQNGLKLRSICARCNSERLGATYDPELIRLSNSISGFVTSQMNFGLSLPKSFEFEIKPQKVARAVVGHILATEIPKANSRPISAPYPDALRNYFLDSSKPMPAELDIYYWIYPSNLQVAANNYTMIPNFLAPEAKARSIYASGILKFFPLGFWVVWRKPLLLNIDLPKLVEDKSTSVDAAQIIPICLRRLPRLDWPEVPGEKDLMMMRKEMTFVGKPLKPKGFGE